MVIHIVRLLLLLHQDFVPNLLKVVVLQALLVGVKDNQDMVPAALAALEQADFGQGLLQAVYWDTCLEIESI